MSRQRATADVEMRRSWLVQRLTNPRQQSGLFGGDNPFSFGGGLRNGGLSEDAMALLRPIFGFDYMGSAEFEFGAVPEALNSMAKAAGSLVAEQATFPLSTIPDSWRAAKDAPKPEGDAVVFILCRSEHLAEVRKRIVKFAAKPYGETKEIVGLARALRPEDDYDSDVNGWLELDNGFMFFTDETMWRQTAAVFGVTP